jgi:hypothetical protein
MANKFKVINNVVNDNLVGLQFATDGGTPLFTVGNFTIETRYSEKVDKNFSQGEASKYFTLEDIGEVKTEDNFLRKNKTKLILNPDYSQPKSYAYFGSLKEYFRVNIEQILINWPASIYVDNVISNYTGDTIENYYYNPITNKSTFYVNNSFFKNYFDIKYTKQFNSNDGLENPLRNLNLQYGKYTIFYNDTEYPINFYTGSTQLVNDYVYFEVIGNPFSVTTGNTLSAKYHIKPNSVEVEKFFSSLSDFSSQLLDRYVTPSYSSKFSYVKESEQGPFDIFVNQVFTWPVTDGYNLDIVSSGYTEYISNLYQFCEYFDENDTNIMNRRLVAEAINRLSTIRRGDGSEDQNEAEKVSKLINIYGREFDEVKKYVDGLSYIKNVTYDKKANTPDSLIKNLSNNLGWSLLRPMSDVDLISSFVPTKSVYSGYTINYSKYDAEIEFWRRLVVNTSHIWKSKGSRKAIEFVFDFIGTPEQLVSFNEHIYIAKKPINVEIFKLILNELTGFNDITPFNVDENGFPKILPETPYNYYQLNGLWYRETAGPRTDLNIFEGNNPHIGPYDGGKEYMDQFKCLIDTFSATSISIFNDYLVFNNLFKNYSNGLIDDYSGMVYLNSYDLDGRPNICFTITGTVTTDPDPEYVLGLCGCPLSVSEQALVIGVKRNDSFQPCNSSKDETNPKGLTYERCKYFTQSTINFPPIILFSGDNTTNIQQVSLECCKGNKLISDATWIETGNGLGYCYWKNNCNNIKIISSTNGSLIFYYNGRTGTTESQLGVNISECCKTFGGSINKQTGECSLINKTQSVADGYGVKSDLPKSTSFGTAADLGGMGFRPRSTASSSSGGNQYESSGCQLTPIKDLNGNILLNSDGTISFISQKNEVYPPTIECCTRYSTTNLPLTFCGGKCYWVNPNQNCSNVDDFKISLGVDGNDGVYLLTGSSETCYFQVEFDMLVNFNCKELLDCVGQQDILPILSAFTINSTIEMLSGNTSNAIQTQPIFNFNINNKPTGVYFSGQESICNALNEQILIELAENCGIVTEETFNSKWVNVKFNISNAAIGKKIKLGFEFKNVPCNFNFLLDNIKIEKLCVVSNEDILNVNSCIGFELERIVDNKKSWDYTESHTIRTVDYLDYRDTLYSEKDSRLLINSKEIDLTLDPSKAIENDLFCYMRKNNCFYYNNLSCDVDNLLVNGSFYNTISGWTTSPDVNSWVWFTGNSAAYNEGDEGGYITQDILDLGKPYNVKFELINEDGSEVYVLAGTNSYGPFTSTTMVDIDVICSGNTNFSIYSINDCSQNKLFQNGDIFIFMSGDTYIFQDQ